MNRKSYERIENYCEYSLTSLYIKLIDKVWFQNVFIENDFKSSGRNLVESSEYDINVFDWELVVIRGPKKVLFESSRYLDEFWFWFSIAMFYVIYKVHTREI